jgi:hypothetical protein
MADRPHSILPTQAFAEADKPSQLFEYYLLDTNEFQPDIFTSIVPGINDAALPTAANEANCGLSTIGSVRVVLEPKPGLPTDPTTQTRSSTYLRTFSVCSSSTTKAAGTKVG